MSDIRHWKILLATDKVYNMQEQGTMLVEHYEALPFFQGLSSDELDLLRALFAVCDVCAGEALFAQGKPAEYLYIVLHGNVDVNFKPDDGPPLTVAHVESGGIVGWSSALGSLTYTSGAAAITDTRLLRIRGDDLRNICERYPATGAVLLDRLAAVIAERLRNTHPQVKAMLESALGPNP
ncbi:MAG: Crp/Fnr family transcriptional regulator [Chloroflexota bacterium]